MNKVIIEPDLNIKDQSFFNKSFAKNRSIFDISKDIIIFVNSLNNRGDRQIIYYVLYKIITENRLDVNISPTPNNGLLFTDYDNKGNSLEIFHCHLNNDMILIWYVEKDSSNNLNLKIEYIKHPNDNYKLVLKNIYKNTDGFNIITNEYFKNYRSSTYLKDNFIEKWFNFKNKL